eukprot:TRINITY_DN3509_c0_g1_i2.p2 TRINITY_DN3509_c0_g1~~TRINITY_DN3509_c0_g1_i2.p2  ORF type:complete len:147 (-),score=36.56 TRINITY_DN3509_c0_g1_i2:1232-1672(-)
MLFFPSFGIHTGDLDFQFEQLGVEKLAETLILVGERYISIDTDSKITCNRGFLDDFSGGKEEITLTPMLVKPGEISHEQLALQVLSTLTEPLHQFLPLYFDMFANTFFDDFRAVYGPGFVESGVTAVSLAQLIDISTEKSPDLLSH